MSLSFPTATTVPAPPHPDTTCTTSTSSPDLPVRDRWPSAISRTTRGSEHRGMGRPPTRAAQSPPRGVASHTETAPLAHHPHPGAVMSQVHVVDRGTVRLTTAQALVRWMLAQRSTLLDGSEVPLFAGVFAIFGHGNVLGL